MTTLHRSKQKQTKPDHKGLHTRNLHKLGYDFPSLEESYPPLAPYVKTNAHGNLSIEFADPLAVKSLNAALLKRHYNIIDWDIPQGALCPPIPGRVDYIHYIAELLGVGEPTTALANAQTKITLLDIGTGANGIYPLLACQIYGWYCVGSDINTASLENVASIITNNPKLKAASHCARNTIEIIYLMGSFKLENSLMSAYATHPFMLHWMKRSKAASVNSVILPAIAVSKQPRPHSKLWRSRSRALV